MKKLFFLFPAFLLLAADPTGFGHFDDASIKAKMATLKSGVSETLGNWGNHQLLIIHRDSTGQAEFHETQADVIIVRAGGGSIKIGGRILDGKTTAPNEIRGTVIEGAQVHPLKEGDVMHIPAKTPHQVMLEAGQTIDYVAVKVDAK